MGKNSNKITLSQLALEFGINKSSLRYWTACGLMGEPVSMFGRTQMFDRNDIKRRYKFILERKGKGWKLEQIRRALVKGGK